VIVPLYTRVNSSAGAAHSIPKFNINGGVLYAHRGVHVHVLPTGAVTPKEHGAEVYVSSLERQRLAHDGVPTTLDHPHYTTPEKKRRSMASQRMQRNVPI